MPEPVRTDQKAGWCSMCRSETHTMCASPTCTCPSAGRRNHPNRPRPRVGDSANPIAMSPSARVAKLPHGRTRRIVPPTIELVWEDPPPKLRPSGVALIDKLHEPLEELKLKPDTFARIVTYASTGAAGAAVKSLRQKGLAVEEWDLVARPLRDPETGAGSGLWARYIGKA